MTANITFILTSCGRFDLLKRTMDSFKAATNWQFSEHICHEDAAHIPNRVEQAMKVYPFDKVIAPDTKQGLAKAWDNLLAQVTTEYVFTCEDDWEFKGNKNFMAQSLHVLQNYPDIHHVWVRDSGDHKHPLGKFIVRDDILTHDVLHWPGTNWNGFSMNPGLRRTPDLRRMFPDGLAAIGDEQQCAIHTAKFNYKAVALHNGACVHIGDGRHTQNFVH